MPGIGVVSGFGIIHMMWLQANGKFPRDPQFAAAPSTTAGDIPS